MAERIEKEIDGVTVFIKKYDPFLAIAIMGDLQKYVLGPAGSLFSMSEGKAGVDLSDFSIETAIEKLSSGIDGDVLVKLVRKIVNPEYVSIQFGEMDKPAKATEGNINLAFSEDPFGGVILLVKEVLEANFTRFFKRAQNLFGSVKAQQAME